MTNAPGPASSASSRPRAHAAADREPVTLRSRQQVDVGRDANTSCRVALDQALENLSQNPLKNEVDLQIADLPEVRFDGIKLIQVVQNLIGNAIAYRDRSRRLHIRVLALPDPAGQQASAVADNGPGIEPEQQVRIFDMFHRAQEVEVAGSGIGLAWCCPDSTKIILKR